MVNDTYDYPQAIEYLIRQGALPQVCEKYAELLIELTFGDSSAPLSFAEDEIVVETEAPAGFTLSVSQLLDGSKRNGQNIERVNELLDPARESVGMERCESVAFALALGDDPICLNVNTGEVYLWLLDGGEKIIISNSLDDFTSIISSDRFLANDLRQHNTE